MLCLQLIENSSNYFHFLRSVQRPPAIKYSAVTVSLAGELHVFSNPGAGCFLAPMLTIAVLGILDVCACWHVLSVHVRPAGVASMRHIAAGYNTIQALKLTLIHHAPICAPGATLRLWQEQFSPLLLGGFDLPVSLCFVHKPSCSLLPALRGSRHSMNRAVYHDALSEHVYSVSPMGCTSLDLHLFSRSALAPSFILPIKLLQNSEYPGYPHRIILRSNSDSAERNLS